MSKPSDAAPPRLEIASSLLDDASDLNAYLRLNVKLQKKEEDDQYIISQLEVC